MSNQPRLFIGEDSAAIVFIPLKRCGRILRAIQIDDGPHAWMDGHELYVCAGHTDNRYEKAPQEVGE